MQELDFAADNLVPNVVVAGAPRSGTSSIFTYLKAHPAVCASEPKETRFLIDPGYPLAHPETSYERLGIEGYGQFFADYDARRHQVIMEATPDYLYQRTALDVLSRLDQTKVIFILRRPADRVRSVHAFAQNRNGAVPGDVTLDEYVEAIQGGSYPSEDVILTGAIDQSRYIDYLDEWISELGTERTLILQFERFQSNPAETMSQIASFVGIDPSFYETYKFAVVNSSTSLRAGHIDTVLRRTAQPFRRHRWYNWFKTHLRTSYNSLQGVKEPASRATPLPALTTDLNEIFHLDNAKLQKVTGLDVSAWNSPTPSNL